VTNRVARDAEQDVKTLPILEGRLCFPFQNTGNSIRQPSLLGIFAAGSGNQLSPSTTKGSAGDAESFPRTERTQQA
jgi:hypothetical protein